ncbi:MAG: FMN-binding negative transcriptional regulator [Flavobacteriales bacterium]|nr:FMN-binding negative transcriptional regulator [Flavobacteriales bacterium]
MYNFSYFKEKDKGVLLQFLNKHPFAFLTGSDNQGKSVASQIPILVEERNGEWYLQGHIMRNTDHYKTFVQNPQVLVVFTGPHSYISATWYTNTSLGSTWNYMSVHIKGEVQFMSDDELVAFMKKFTLHFENGDTNSPTYYDNLPDEFINRMMPAIAGFEIKVDEMENVFKLSQNRDMESYLNIISELNQQGGSSKQIALEMEKRIEQLFPTGFE